MINSFVFMIDSVLRLKNEFVAAKVWCFSIRCYFFRLVSDFRAFAYGTTIYNLFQDLERLVFTFCPKKFR